MDFKICFFKIFSDSIVLQIVFFAVGVALSRDDGATEACPSESFLTGIPLPSWLLFVWPAPLLGLNELVKHYEIKYVVVLCSIDCTSI